MQAWTRISRVLCVAKWRSHERAVLLCLCLCLCIAGSPGESRCTCQALVGLSASGLEADSSCSCSFPRRPRPQHDNHCSTVAAHPSHRDLTLPFLYCPYESAIHSPLDCCFAPAQDAMAAPPPDLNAILAALGKSTPTPMPASPGAR
jgi:hypothetical protein